MEKLILIGCGGHAESVADSVLRSGKYDIAGFVSRSERENKTKILNRIPFIGTDDDLGRLYDSGIRRAFISIGFMGGSDPRDRIYAKLTGIGYKTITVIDPSAVIAAGTHIGESSYVGKRAVVNANARIGSTCIVNTAAVVEHDCRVGAFSHIAVGAVLCGNVTIGKGVLIGANATIIQGVSVGDNAVVGAGAVVRHDVGQGQVCYGG